MRIKELLSGLTEDIGPGKDWNPHTMGAPGSVAPFAPQRGNGPSPAPMQPIQPMQPGMTPPPGTPAARMGQATDSFSASGPNAEMAMAPQEPPPRTA